MILHDSVCTKTGAFHNIVHVKRANTHGLHYWSLDGLAWTSADSEMAPASYAYNATMQWDDGTSHHFACRERPHIVQNDKGEVIALTNGAAPEACNNAGQVGPYPHAISFLM